MRNEKYLLFPTQRSRDFTVSHFLWPGSTHTHHNKPVTQLVPATSLKFWLVPTPAYKDSSVYFASWGKSTILPLYLHIT